MEEKTLKLAQTLARQSLASSGSAGLEEEELGEALDGSPRPLRKNHLAKVKEPNPFRYVVAFFYIRGNMSDYCLSGISPKFYYD